MFRVGQKVVCIKRGNWNGQPGTPCGPVYDEICIVRGMDSSGRDGLLLHGYFGNFYDDGSERGFAARRFRPVVERKTDISVFKAMLNDAPVERIKERSAP